jgi:aspartate aminotransferase-like enzyme
VLPVSFLPGPVDVAWEVRQAFDAHPVSHRAKTFHTAFGNVKERLCRLVNAAQVEILLGTGSLANDVVAGQISLLEQPGLILSNGEFGQRLVDHATRFGLDFEVLTLEWGEALDPGRVGAWVESHPGATWLWAAHCETSTGVLNDLGFLRDLVERRDLKLCMDCISSVGTVPVDLGGVYLAACVSGKGLGAYPGLSMVFYNHEVVSAPRRLPRYLDLGYYAQQDGVPFTHSSNLLAALHASLKCMDWPGRFERLIQASARLREALRGMGYEIVADKARTSPAVITLELPVELRSKTVGWLLQKSGYLVSYRSEYLLKRNWIQICLMGELSEAKLDALLALLHNYRPRRTDRREAVLLESAGV